MARRRLSPDERRTELVAAARQLFATQGVEGTSISDIVKAAGVAQGTFYWYFASKQEALNAVVREMTDEACGAVMTLAGDPSLTGLTKFRRVFEVFLATVVRGGDTLEYFHAETNREFHDQLASEMARRLAPALGGIIRQGVAEGTFTTAYPEEAAAFILAANEVVYDEAFFPEREPVEHRVEALMDFVWRGLGGRERRPPTAGEGNHVDR